MYMYKLTLSQYVSKMNKLNFDLKLEIFHRAQQTVILEKKLKRMHELEERVQEMEALEEELQELREVEENNERLRESNEQLRLELDKRDQAVNEAVELICQLEAKIESLESNQGDECDSTNRPHTDGLSGSSESSPRTSTPRSRIIVDVPDRSSSRKGTSSALSLRSRAGTPGSSRRPRRQPSFLRDSSGSTSALRSLYVPENTDRSHGALEPISRTQSNLSHEEHPELESPRLSILSECSYFKPSAGPSRPTETNNMSTSHVMDSTPKRSISETKRSDEKLNRVDQWIQPRTLFVPPASKQKTPLNLDTSRGSSKKRPSLGAAFDTKRTSNPHKLQTPAIDGPMFNGGRLPPTPDTMSTNPDIRGSSNSSIIAEKSRRDQGRYYASFVKGRSLERRRSADDITTRPSTEETFSETTDTLSDETQLGHGNDEKNRLVSIFPSFSQSTYQYSDNVGEFDTDGEDVIHTPSKSRTDKRHVRVSSSPPLTPQDWLEAAQSVEDVDQLDQSEDNSGAFKNEAVQTNLEDEAEPMSEEPQLPPTPSLRLRVGSKNKDQYMQTHSQTRRRLSLRPKFFNRSNITSQNTTPMSDPVAKDSSPFSGIRKPRNFSAAIRRKSLSNEVPPTGQLSTRGQTPVDDEVSNQKEDKDGSHQTASTAPQNRPLTAEGPENKRRSGLGLFSWMRGSNTSGPQAKDIESRAASPTVISECYSTTGKEGAVVPAKNLKAGVQSSPVMPSHDAENPAFRQGFGSVTGEITDKNSKFSYRRSRIAQ